MMKSNYFFIDAEEDVILENTIITQLKDYANLNCKQIYVIQSALSTNTEYIYKKACAIIIPHHKLLVANFDASQKNYFDDYWEDFLEDLGYLSEKYGYREILGRPRDWRHLIEKISGFELNTMDDFSSFEVTDQRQIRTIELLTSLLIGSINDIRKIGSEIPDTLLKKIKSKIVLYDGTQSSFIYQDDNTKKVINIQGLAGTGKTELLIHKIREKYVRDKDSRIVYTCFNKVLEEDMQQRIPKLFNFMKVEEQIEWNKRLWVMRAWGSGSDRNSGVCSYIASKYGVPFYPFSLGYDLESFSEDLLIKLRGINDANKLEPCFDYVFIDEGQDFGKNFRDLCEMVTEKQVFIAGDVFQNIFDMNDSGTDTDFVLNKCYRTDPKTLMFAHAVGMGLYERPVVRWLSDNQWELCGYEIKKDNDCYNLSRNPIRRFEDVPDSSNSVFIREIKSIDGYASEVSSCIEEIRRNNTDVTPDDIAIVFIHSNMKTICNIANAIEVELFRKFGWLSNKGYETKQREPDRVFISNRNNIKGLEFPFVICIVPTTISRDIGKRNSIYMTLTRSFLISYFLINNVNDENKEFIDLYRRACGSILENKAIIINAPSNKEIEESNRMLIEFNQPIDRYEVYKKIQKEYNLDNDILSALKLLTKGIASNQSVTNEEFFKILIESLKAMKL